MNQNLLKLTQNLPENCDGALITSQVNRLYYTGIKTSSGLLMVTRDSAVFLTDFRYIEMSRKKADGFDVVLQDTASTQLPKLMEDLKIKTLAVESAALTLGEFLRYKAMLPGVTLPDNSLLSEGIALQRSVKSQEEFLKMQRAQSLADSCFSEILNFIREGITEKQVALELAILMRRKGAAGESFSTIAISGENTALPHGVPTDKVIKKGELFTLDFGVMLEDYCSDMTRTVAVGEPDEEKQKLYYTVLKAQQAAFEAIKVGASLRGVDAAARDLIENAGYHNCFGHGLGHSLGMQIHEDPRFSPTAVGKLKAGTVISVEPGIYLEGRFGCRIEDVIFVTDEKIINLATSPKNLIIL